MGGITLESPYIFRERTILFGGGGAGKTNAVLSIMRRVRSGKFWITDNDISAAYQRALETDFADILDEHFDLNEVEPGWEPFVESIQRTVREGDPKVDWLIADSVTPSWDDVQSWYAQTVMGMSFAEYVAKVRSDANNMTEFNKVMAADGRWQIINKEYFEKFYGALRKWKGHFILTAEAQALSRDAGEEERELYGHLGVRPKGQGRMHHVAHTTILLSKRGHGQYVASTAKDRNRMEMDKLDYGEDFAMGYLKGVAGWQVRVVKDGVNE
jgi:hypothetical protein